MPTTTTSEGKCMKCCNTCKHEDDSQDYSGDTIDCKKFNHTVERPWSMVCDEYEEQES